MEDRDVDYILTPCIIIDEHYLFKDITWSIMQPDNLYSSSMGVQTRFWYLTRKFICIIPLR
jgi:hypothetical protein